MAPMRGALILLVVVAIAVTQVSPAPMPKPQPFSLKKIANNVVNKVKNVGQQAMTAMSPTLNCLSKAGAGSAALGWLKDCGTTGKFYGKFALASCAATEYAPADVKTMVKSSAKCFSLG